MRGCRTGIKKKTSLAVIESDAAASLSTHLMGSLLVCSSEDSAQNNISVMLSSSMERGV